MKSIELFLLMATLSMAGMILYDRVMLLLKRPPGLLFNAALVALLVGAVFSHALILRGVVWSLLFFAITTVVPYLVEAIGVRTGIPFGHYRYTKLMEPFGPFGVPVAVAGIWPVVLYFSVVDAEVLFTYFDWTMSLSRLLPTAAVIAMAADFLIEPTLVTKGYWIWDRERSSRIRWRTIPWTNFVGWFGTALFTLILAFAANGFLLPHQPNFTGDWLFPAPLLWAGLGVLNLVFAALHDRIPEVVIGGIVVCLCAFWLFYQMAFV
ncbi:MAG: carotenoid biosynthesis protein [bacterium]|nr:carotenoid biosynthesis protein [bacterium]